LRPLTSPPYVDAAELDQALNALRHSGTTSARLPENSILAPIAHSTLAKLLS
jgi:hypothetical protein